MTGIITGNANLGNGANILAAAALTGYTGGAGSDTVTLKPASDASEGMNLGAVNLGTAQTRCT